MTTLKEDKASIRPAESLGDIIPSGTSKTRAMLPTLYVSGGLTPHNVTLADGTVLEMSLEIGVVHPLQVLYTPTIPVNEWWLAPGVFSFEVEGAYSAIHTSDKTTAKLDVSGNGQDLTEIGNVGWDTTNGFGGFTETDYFNTGYAPDTNCTVIVRFSHGVASLNQGCLAGSNQVSLWHTYQPLSQRSAVSNGGFYDFGTEYTEGVLGVAGNGAYIDGTLHGTFSISSVPQQDLIIGAFVNAANTVTGSARANIQAVAIYSTILLESQIAEISANMAVL